MPRLSGPCNVPGCLAGCLVGIGSTPHQATCMPRAPPAARISAILASSWWTGKRNWAEARLARRFSKPSPPDFSDFLAVDDVVMSWRKLAKKERRPLSRCPLHVRSTEPSTNNQLVRVSEGSSATIATFIAIIVFLLFKKSKLISLPSVSPWSCTFTVIVCFPVQLICSVHLSSSLSWPLLPPLGPLASP